MSDLNWRDPKYRPVDPTPDDMPKPEGGERKASRVAHDLGWMRGQLAKDFAEGRISLPITPDEHGVIDTIGEAIEHLGRIADLERRLAEAVKDYEALEAFEAGWKRRAEVNERLRDQAQADAGEFLIRAETAERDLTTARSTIEGLERRIGERQTWRHVKTGGLYELREEDCPACREADLEPVTIYRSLTDGRIWVRPSIEFYDGRFVQENAALTPDAGEGR